MKTFQRIGFGLGLGFVCLASSAASSHLGSSPSPSQTFSGTGDIGVSMLQSPDVSSFARTSRPEASAMAAPGTAADAAAAEDTELSSSSATLLAGIGVWALLARRRLNR